MTNKTDKPGHGVLPVEPQPAKCPLCDSPKPYLHPAMQADGGEIEICKHPWHGAVETVPVVPPQLDQINAELNELPWDPPLKENGNEEAAENDKVRVREGLAESNDVLRVSDAPPCWHKNIGEDTICKDCGHKAAIKFNGVVPQGAEPTIAEAERFIRKMEKCEGMAAKLILLQHFLGRHAAASQASAPPRQGPLCDNCGKPERAHYQLLYCYLSGSQTYHPSENRAVPPSEDAPPEMSKNKMPNTAWAEEEKNGNA